MASYTTYVVKTKKQFKTLTDTTRSRIIRLMRKSGEPMTVKMIADEMNEKHGNVFYHVKKLIDADFLDLVKTESINGIIAKYYVRKYDLIYVSPDVKKEVALENPTQYREYKGTTFRDIVDEYLEQIHPHDIPIDIDDDFFEDKLFRGYYHFDTGDLSAIKKEVIDVFMKYDKRTKNTERYVTMNLFGKQRKDIYKPADEVKKDALDE